MGLSRYVLPFFQEDVAMWGVEHAKCLVICYWLLGAGSHAGCYVFLRVLKKNRKENH